MQRVLSAPRVSVAPRFQSATIRRKGASRFPGVVMNNQLTDSSITIVPSASQRGGQIRVRVVGYAFWFRP